MPSCVAVICVASINHCATVPTNRPGIPTPAATTAAHQCTDSNAGPERNHTRRSDFTCGVIGHYVGCSVDDRRIVLRNVNDLWVCRFNHDGARRLLYYFDLFV